MRRDYGPIIAILAVLLLPVWLPVMVLFWLCHNA